MPEPQTTLSQIHPSSKPSRSLMNVWRSLAGVAILGLSLLVSGCAAAGFPLDPRTGVVVENTSEFTEMQFELIPNDHEHVIEIPGAALRVNKTYRTDSLPSSMSRYFPIENTERQEIVPAPGEEFLLVQLLGSAPSFMPDSDLGGVLNTRVLVNDEEVIGHGSITRVDLLEYRPQIWILVSIPEDSAAEDILLEVSDGERTQQLSLLDGSRTYSDLEEYYGDPFTASIEDTWWEFRDEAAAGDNIVTAGLVLGVQVSPALSSTGWAEPGHVFVGIDVEHVSQVRGFTHASGLALMLPDGSTIEPLDHGIGAFPDADESTTWFAVPLDTSTATLSIHLAGTFTDAETGSTTDLDFGTTEAALTFGGAR